ncbi:MAG: peptidylprolyl isomerase [Pseudomonadota bacterium]|nr:peptidylprolyl isomerase [Pseudomonadota bacterium]
MNFARRLALAAFAAAACLPLATLAQTQPSSCQPKGSTPMKVKLTTSMGPIVIELDKARAPVSVDNFVKYVESGHYNGTIFHRVIDGFMIQGGGFGNDMLQKPTQPPIKNEGGNGVKNDAYTLAMARTSIPDSATSQFFINVSDNASLNASGGNAGYAVFGKVVEGKDTVDKIRKVATGNKGGHQNVPTEAVVIEKAECV